MIVPLFIFSATTGDPVAGVVPVFTFYKRRDAGGNLTNLSPPTIVDRGSGLYEFVTTPGDAIAGTIITYVVDCGLTALTRYQDGNINGDEAVAAAISVISTLVLFGVDAGAVRRHHFGQWADFSEVSVPTATTVAEMIDDCAGEFAGHLIKEEIDPNTIVAGTAPYVTCRNVLRKMVAARIMADATNQDSTLLAKWQKELDAFFERLDTDGSIALGDPDLSAASSEPDGPTTHLDEYDIDIGDPLTDASDAITPFRKDDCL